MIWVRGRGLRPTPMPSPPPPASCGQDKLLTTHTDAATGGWCAEELSIVIRFVLTVHMLSGASECMGRLRRACTAVTALARAILASCPAPSSPFHFKAVVSRAVQDHTGACAARCALPTASIDDWSAFAAVFVPLSLEDWWAGWLLDPSVHSPPGSTLWVALRACTGFLEKFAALVAAVGGQNEVAGAGGTVPSCDGAGVGSSDPGLGVAIEVTQRSEVALDTLRVVRSLMAMRCAEEPAGGVHVGHSTEKFFTVENWLWRWVALSILCPSLPRLLLCSDSSVPALVLCAGI